jgi:hypothetical protein
VSTDLAITPPDADLSPSAEREFGALWRLAQKWARADNIPRELHGKPQSVFLVLAHGAALGVAPAHALNGGLWSINGRIEPSAQVRVGVAMAHGHEVEPDETTSERCTIAVRRRGSDRWQRLTYTIADAERAGALDEWVERWVKTDRGKNYKETYVVSCRCGRHQGIPEPQWAAKERDAGRVKRKDAWWQFPDDMLYAAAARRATKRFTPDAFLQIDPPDLAADGDELVEHPGDYGEPDVHERAGAAAAGPEGDDEIADAEVVEPAVEPEPAEVPDPAPSPRAPEPEAPTQDVQPVAGPAFSRSFAIDCAKADIEDDGRHALIAYATGGRTRTSKEVRKGTEAGACFAALAGVQEGRLTFSVDDAGEVVVVDKETA